MLTDRQTDKHDEANSRFSQFCERAKNGNFSYLAWMHLQYTDNWTVNGYSSDAGLCSADSCSVDG